MKTFKSIVVLLVILTGVSCSSDDDNSTAPTLSNEKQITGFSFLAAENPALSADVAATVNETTQTISTDLPIGTDVTALQPEIEVSARASFSPEGEQDFTTPVVYTVAAEDGTTVDYTVSITVALSEIETLTALYEANPSNTLGWDLTSTDISTWDGVLVDGDGVYGLNLTSKNLTVIPEEIRFLSSLKMLSVADNNLTSVPPAILQLHGLTHLTLSQNLLTGLPEEVAELSSLTHLGLELNQFTDLPVVVTQLTELTRLYLSDNQLTDLPEEIAELSNLTHLHLGNNQFTNFPIAITQLTGLTNLELNDNQLNGIPEEIADLINLISLKVDDNELTEVPVEIGQLFNLGYLHLQNNLITSIPQEVCDLIADQGTVIYSDAGLNCGEPPLIIVPL